MFKRAIVLAGGKGKRLQPYSQHIPKPLMPLGNYPILEIIIRQLAYHGFEHITLALNYRAGAIRRYIGDGSRLGIYIDYSHESHPLGTMGPVALLKDLPDHFLIMNSDILTDLDFSAFYEAHVAENSLFTIAAYEHQEEQAFGVLDMDERGFLKDFREKPTVRFNVSMGIYMAHADILRRIPQQQAYGFDQLVHQLISEKQPPRVQLHRGVWMDIGCPEDYERAVKEFTRSPRHFLPDTVSYKSIF